MGSAYELDVFGYDSDYCSVNDTTGVRRGKPCWLTSWSVITVESGGANPSQVLGDLTNQTLELVENSML